MYSKQIKNEATNTLSTKNVLKMKQSNDNAFLKKWGGGEKN